jgi:hypothetical protein
VCKPYQYSLSTERKIVVACLPILVFLFVLISYVLLARGFICLSQSDPGNVSNVRHNQSPGAFYVWSTFLGAYDIVSDWTLLVLIEPFNPYMIFWVAVISLPISSGIQLYRGWTFARTLSLGTEKTWRLCAFGPSYCQAVFLPSKCLLYSECMLNRIK